MQGFNLDVHLLILLTIMLVNGAFGGYLNYLNDFDTLANEQKNKRGKFKYILLGIGAAFLIPLFLKMISSNIISSSENLDYLVFAGFCLVAAIFSRRFISTIGDKILEAANRAEKAALESKQKSEITQRELLSTKERIEDVKLAVDIKNTEVTVFETDKGQSKELLIALAGSYSEKTSVADYVQRLKLKAELGRKMGEIIIRNRLSKGELLKEHSSEGMLLAIAYAVQLRPAKEDWIILNKIAPQAGQLFTKYSILTGYDTLARNSLIPKNQLGEVLDRVDDFRNQADSALFVKIDETENILSLLSAGA
ncbi:MAG: YEATS-associated helix-containing protein [Anditalea sp.]